MSLLARALRLHRLSASAVSYSNELRVNADREFWEKLGNVISDDKYRIWGVLETAYVLPLLHKFVTFFSRAPFETCLGGREPRAGCLGRAALVLHTTFLSEQTHS